MVKEWTVDRLEISGNEKSLQCLVCLKGKSTAVSFINRTGKRSRRVLELIHSDVNGPMTGTNEKQKQYIVTFIDDYSHFLSSYVINTKDKVFAEFKGYKQWAEDKTRQKIGTLNTDNGGEYTATAFRNYLTEHAIQHCKTIAYTPK